MNFSLLFRRNLISLTNFGEEAMAEMTEKFLMFPTGVGRSGVGSDAKIYVPIATSSVNRFAPLARERGLKPNKGLI